MIFPESDLLPESQIGILTQVRVGHPILNRCLLGTTLCNVEGCLRSTVHMACPNLRSGLSLGLLEKSSLTTVWEPRF